MGLGGPGGPFIVLKLNVNLWDISKLNERVFSSSSVLLAFDRGLL